MIDVEEFPLTRLSSTTACETAKVLENSYRATLIAFMEEWGRFAEATGVDLFEVIGTIRRRPTHSNMRQPGFGVGGYCLTKDPLLGMVSARDLFGHEELDFPFSRLAVAVNRVMPLAASTASSRCSGAAPSTAPRSLLMGVSYRQEVADTRFSPSETFVREARHARRDRALPRPAGAPLARAAARRRGRAAVACAASTPWCSPCRTPAIARSTSSAGWRRSPGDPGCGRRARCPTSGAAFAALGCDVASIGRGERL